MRCAGSLSVAVSGLRALSLPANPSLARCFTPSLPHSLARPLARSASLSLLRARDACAPPADASPPSQVLCLSCEKALVKVLGWVSIGMMIYGTIALKLFSKAGSARVAQLRGSGGQAAMI